MGVLITGAGGFFGRALVLAFAQGGEQVVAADLVEPHEFEPRPQTPRNRLKYIKLDVVKPSSALDATPTIDGIVHAAALTPTAEQMKGEPAKLINVNLIGTLNMLEIARKRGAEKFLFVSSAGVYNQLREAVVHEEDADGGFSLYGSAKLAAEIMLWRYGKMYKLDVGAIRPTSMFGPAEALRQTRPFVTPVKRLVDAALSGEAVRIEGADARCDWIYVDDVAEAAYHFWRNGLQGRVFNLSSGFPTPFGQVAQAVDSALGLDIRPDGKLIDGKPDRPTVIANDRARAQLGLKPRALEDALRIYANEQRAQEWRAFYPRQ